MALYLRYRLMQQIRIQRVLLLTLLILIATHLIGMGDIIQCCICLCCLNDHVKTVWKESRVGQGTGQAAQRAVLKLIITPLLC